MTPHAVYALMQDKITLEQLNEVCLELGLELANVASSSLTVNAQSLELVLYCGRHQTQEKLVAILSR